MTQKTIKKAIEEFIKSVELHTVNESGELRFVSPLGARESNKHWWVLLNELKEYHDYLIGLKHTQDVSVKVVDLEQDDFFSADYAAVHGLMVQAARLPDKIEWTTILKISDIDYLKRACQSLTGDSEAADDKPAAAKKPGRPPTPIEHKRAAKRLRDEGKTWAGIAKAVNEKFGTEYTQKAVPDWFRKR